ncbi:C39 family peptidase [Saccharopolyspora tripterygii]
MAPSAPEVRPQAVTKSLAVDYQAQETGYWCGPAAARIALSAVTKDLPSQAALANELGTTENGTDHISQFVDVLNKRLEGTRAPYVTKEWAGRPITPEMKNELWSDVVRNVDAGKATVTNIVAAPGNQPPGYPADQTIYHYVSVVGYNAENKTVHISDSARFSGITEHWLSLDQLASLIQTKGYAA